VASVGPVLRLPFELLKRSGISEVVDSIKDGFRILASVVQAWDDFLGEKVSLAGEAEKEHLHIRGTRHVQYFSVERLRIARDQVAAFARVADGSDHAVTTLKELIGELAAEAAADACDKPCPL
jgi:hypothetical protein